MFKKVFKAVFGAFLLSLLALAIVFAYGRLRGPSPEQAEVLRILSEKPKYDPATNAEAYFWLLDYDVPEDKIQAITEEDVKRYNGLTDPDSIMNYQTVAAKSYPKRKLTHELIDRLCSRDNIEKCLDGVSENKEVIQKALIERNSEVFALEKISNYKSYYLTMEMHLAGFIPAHSAGEGLRLASIANEFLYGDSNLAIDKTCQQIGAFRLISANSDTLVSALLAQALAKKRMQLLAYMLNRSSVQKPLLPSCEAAFVPVATDEKMLCHAFYGEFDSLRNLDVWINADTQGSSSEISFSSTDNLMMKLPSSHEIGMRVNAPSYARFCSIKAREAAEKNVALTQTADDRKASSCDMVDWVAAPQTCVLFGMAAADYDSYVRRRLHQAVQTTAMRNFLWLREQNSNSGDVEALLEARDNNLKEFDDQIEFDFTKGEIRALYPEVERYGLTLPMPANIATKTTQ
jgi:hypothetical protein